MDRLEGFLEIGEGFVADFELRAGDSKLTRSQRAPCRLRLDDGTLVEVNASRAAIKGWNGAIVCKGTWAEIQSNAAAELFADLAPGPHVSATLRGRGPRDGDAVVLDGELQRAAPDTEAASYRDEPPEPVPVRIDVATILNPSANKTPRKNKKHERRNESKKTEPDPWAAGWSIVCAGLALFAGLGIVQAALLPRTAACLAGGWGLALGLALFALVAAVNRRALPDFVRANKLEDGRDTLIVLWAVGGSIVLVAALAAATESIPLLASGDPLAVSLTKRGAVAGLRANMLRGYATLLLCGVGALAFTQWLLTRRAATRAGLLVGAASKCGSFDEGAWALVEGVIRCDKSVVRQCVRTYLGKYAGTSTSVASHPFLLESSECELEIGTEGVWATTRRRRQGNTLTLSINHGWSAIAAGRIERIDGKPGMSGKGEESLLLFATHRASARAVLRRTLQARSYLLAVFAASLVAAAAVCLLPML